MSNTAAITVIAAHPDDEVLGFGGTIRRHADAGDNVHVLILATGAAARTADGDTGESGIEALRAQARAAADVLGVSEIAFADFPDNRMDMVPLLDVAKRIEDFLAHCAATTVYTHHNGDLNVDHRVTAQAVLTACRPLPGARVQRICAGEVLSSSEYAAPGDRFRPNHYVGIEQTLARKCEALACYTGELRPWPHPRSVEAVEALARLRGSECGLHAAEAFNIYREVLR